MVGRHRRAVSHRGNGGHGWHHTRQQQRQGGGVVGREAGGEIIRDYGARRIQPATHVHHLGGAFWLPGMLLLAGELHPHRAAGGAGEQGGVGSHVIGAVAAVAASRFLPHHLDAVLRQ